MENERAGNQESRAQFNAIDEVVDRLRTECAEVEVNANKRMEIFERYRDLYEREVTCLAAAFTRQESFLTIEFLYWQPGRWSNIEPRNELHSLWDYTTSGVRMYPLAEH